MISIEHLTKCFGSHVAVNNLGFTVGQGEVLGFLGPNGAGKSTTMKMLTGFLRPTAGVVTVGGIDIWKNPLPAKRLIGYLPEGGPCYGEMTVQDFLVFVCQIRGIPKTKINSAIAGVVDTIDLQSVMGQSIDTLSKGFKRRVGLAQAIIHDPAVLVLDEPTDGLDPNQKHQVRNLIAQLAKNKTIIISTHILEEVSAVCTRAIIIAEGKMVADSTPAELETRAESHRLDDVFRALTGGRAA